MAEGLQRRIEYSGFKIYQRFAMEKILDFQTWRCQGNMPEETFDFCCQKMRQA